MLSLGTQPTIEETMAVIRNGDLDDNGEWTISEWEHFVKGYGLSDVQVYYLKFDSNSTGREKGG